MPYRDGRANVVGGHIPTEPFAQLHSDVHRRSHLWVGVVDHFGELGDLVEERLVLPQDRIRRDRALYRLVAAAQIPKATKTFDRSEGGRCRLCCFDLTLEMRMSKQKQDSEGAF